MTLPPIPDKFAMRVPDGDNRERLMCGDCGWIHYSNPKIIVGAVCTWQDKLLLCKRAIEPRVGYWTMPAGFMEEGETAEEGAAREAMEEAGAEIAIDRLLAVYSVPRISQVHLIYRAQLVHPKVEVGTESSEVQLVDWSDVPWQDLAFPTVHWALAHFKEVEGKNDFTPFVTPPQAIENMRRHFVKPPSSPGGE